MKKFNKYIALGLGALTLASCESLDTEYLGYYVTQDQKDETLELNPEMSRAAVISCFSAFSSYMSVYDYHFDFGYPSIMLGLDLQGQDMICDDSGYNWFSYWEGYTSPTASGTPTSMAWYHIYDQIFAANAALVSFAPSYGSLSETEVAKANEERMKSEAYMAGLDALDNEIKYYRAQAVATRAFDYWVLAQLYQFNYAGNETKPCVPIITEQNSAIVETEGAARASVQEVYDLILADLDEAVYLISKSGYTPDQVIDSKPKRMVSLATAYGLRARVYLTMHKYDEAAKDAQAAIQNFSGKPYSSLEVSKPSFASLDDNAWMWGIAINENDRVVTSGIVNWPSMVCTFCGNGYVSVGAWKYLNQDVYDGISPDDVRKGWFLNSGLTSKNLTKAQQNYIDSYDGIPPYTNVKFDSYKGVVGQSTNANDIPLMRIEEMYYILAESQAMSGNFEAGKETITSFINNYRNPKWVSEATTAAELQNEIYQDRRVEFYGEGLSYFDLMRLNLPVQRAYKNWPAAYSLEVAADDVIRIYCIPKAEITANPKLSDSDNNPEGTRPSPVL